MIKTLARSVRENVWAALLSPLCMVGEVYMEVRIPTIIATIVVFDAVRHWNSWIDNYIYNSDERLNTLQLILYNFLNESTRLAKIIQETGDASITAGYKFTPMSVRMTVTMLVMIPILCVYPFMQRYFVKGVMIGAIKG